MKKIEKIKIIYPELSQMIEGIYRENNKVIDPNVILAEKLNELVEAINMLIDNRGKWYEF